MTCALHGAGQPLHSGAKAHPRPDSSSSVWMLTMLGWGSPCWGSPSMGRAASRRPPAGAHERAAMAAAMAGAPPLNHWWRLGVA